MSILNSELIRRHPPHNVRNSKEEELHRRDDRYNNDGELSSVEFLLPPDLLQQAACDYHFYNLNYSILRSVLAGKWRVYLEFEDDAAMDELIYLTREVHSLAVRLKLAYRDYLDAPQLVDEYAADEFLYRYLHNLLLSKRQVNCRRRHELRGEMESRQMLERPSKTKALRSGTGKGNRYRLIFIRTKKVLDTSVPIVASLHNKKLALWYMQFAGGLGKYFNVPLSWLSWVFYLPRFLTNLVLVAKHAVSGWGMSTDEGAKPAARRVRNQLVDKWFELANDGVWISGGILTCFILTGGLAGAGMFLTFSLYGVDCILAALKCFHQGEQLNQQKQKAQAELAKVERELAAMSQQECQELLLKRQSLLAHIEQINLQILHQESAAVVSMAVSVGLFLAFSLMLPVFTAPIIPLVGAGLILMICLAGLIAQNNLAKCCPCKKLTKKDITFAAVFRQSFFKPAVNRQAWDMEERESVLSLS